MNKLFYYLRLPAVFIPVIILLCIGSFAAGDILHDQIYNPLVPHKQTVDFSSLNDLYSLMQKNFDGKFSATAALEGAKHGLISAGGDPYTVYLSPKEAKALNDNLNGKLSGIGAEIGIKNNYLTVVAPISGAPAEKSGVRAGDIIASIDGEDSSTMSVDTAVSKIRGPKGTKVTLKLVRSGVDPFSVTITRDDITVPSVTWSMKNGNVAYINISRFGSDTADLTDKAARELKSQGATRVILDLRNDGGGYLDAGVSVASEFLPAGDLVVEERTGGISKSKLNATAGGQLVGLPVVVLINGGSASASEIVSGALHDDIKAQLVGEKSFGKGSVQEIHDLISGAQLKVTIAHWYTPGGVNINKEGIKPDVEIKLTNDDYNANRDPQLDKALDLLK